MRQDDHDLTDPGFFATGDPLAILTRLRAHDPIHWTQGALDRGFWSLTRYADVKTLFMHDNRIFSPKPFGSALPANAQVQDPETSYMTHLLRSEAFLSVMDGQRHSHLRKVFAERFARAGIAELETMVRRSAARLIEPVLDAGECDFTVQLAGLLPLMVIAEMMDIPAADADDSIASTT